MKILAVDIGSASIKCILIETKFKSFEIVMHDTIPVSDALSPFSVTDQMLSPGQVDALRELEMRHTKNVERIVTNLPLALYSSRVMNFPFKDKRKITAAVNFAIEDEIPFNLEDCIVTSHIYPMVEKQSHVLTAFAPLAPLETFVQSLENIHLSVDALVVDQAAYASLFAKLKHVPQQKGIAVLNLGHKKSTISIYQNGLPILHRTTNIGGFHVTQAIAKKYSISLAEAELAKQDRAFLAQPGMELNEDQRFFATMIESVLDPVFHDFEQALMAFASRSHEQVNTILLSGGSAQIPGISDHLSQRWGKPVDFLLPVSQLGHSAIHPQKNTEILLSAAIALGLSQINGDSKTTLNFRIGPLKNQKTTSLIKWDQFHYPLKLASIIYLFVFMSSIAQLVLLKSQVTDKEKKLDSAIQTIFGRTSASYTASLKGSPQKLKQAVDKKMEELQTQFGGGDRSAFSALDVLNTLSSSVTTTATMEIKQMQLSPTAINLNIESPSKEDAENAVKQLSSLPFVQNPKATPIEAASGTRKKYSFNSALVLPKDEK